jgi:hypothetical protein
MTNADWWARVVSGAHEAPRPEAAARVDAAQGRARGCDRPQGGSRHRRRGRAHGGRELRRTRLFRSHEQTELVGAIADTRAMLEAKGWE